MTKRIIGLILAIAAIAVIVIAAIRHNTYTSMIGPAATEMPAPEKRGKNGAGNSAARFAHCGQTRHGTANGRPCRAGTVIENNLTIGIFPFGGNAERTGSDMQSDFCTFHAKSFGQIPG